MSAVRNELVVTRVFDAPVSLVYKVWTEPDHVVCWWMPKGFSAPRIEKMEVRVGGEWRVQMPHESGMVCTAYGVYREVVKEKRLAWDDFCDENGKYFHKAFVSVDFEALSANKTRVTVRGTLEEVPGRDPRWTLAVMEAGWAAGWKDNLELLHKHLPQATSSADREMVISRLYDAPPELVFKAWTDPEHLKHWWGPNGFTITTHAFEMKVGGTWRFTMHGPDGTDYPNLTTFLVVEPPKRLVYDHGENDERPRMFQTTVTFEQQGKQTLLTLRALFDTAAERDRVCAEVGAIEGGKQTLARLAEFLPKMQ
jgi:uncharacterized protein YndB with AHSA1/START domain